MHLTRISCCRKHLVGRVIMYGDSMQFGILNDEFCSELIDDEEIKVPFVEMESGYLLTATPTRSTRC